MARPGLSRGSRNRPWDGTCGPASQWARRRHGRHLVISKEDVGRESPCSRTVSMASASPQHQYASGLHKLTPRIRLQPHSSSASSSSKSSVATP